METLKKDWLTWLLLLAPFVFIIFTWDKYPDQIPTHFDLNGVPDDYGSKAFGLFLLPGINVVMYFMFLVFPKIDPSGKNYKLFSDKYSKIRIVLHVFFTFMFFVIALYTLGYHFNLSLVIIYGLLALMLMVGNYIGNVKHNYFVGVRIPWTLSNEENWTKTHRFTAKLWVGTSLLMMLIIPFIKNGENLLAVYIPLITVVPIIYSFVLFKKSKTN